MYTEKINEIVEYITRNELDAFWISSPKNIEYLTGFKCDPHERVLGLCIKSNGDVSILCPMLEENAAKKKTKNISIMGYMDTENAFEKFKTLTGELKKIAIESNHLTVERLRLLQEHMMVEGYGMAEQYLKNMRKYKSEEEIENIRNAASLADKAMAVAKENLKEGITELELKTIIDTEMKKLGVKNMSFDTMVLFGKNAADPHGESGKTKLQKGDYALFDLGCDYEGYASDETRTMAFGEVSEEAKKIYDIVYRANTEAIKAVKPGVKFSDLDKIARDIITEAGYGEYFTHRLGHGMGLEVHEYPDVSSTTHDLLEEGMVFTIEPGIYVPEVAGVRLEDDILVTKNGYEVLTKYPK